MHRLTRATTPQKEMWYVKGFLVKCDARLECMESTSSGRIGPWFGTEVDLTESQKAQVASI